MSPTSGKKPKIALLVEASDVIGGIQSATNRHVRLLKEDYEIVSVAFENSKKESDWAGFRKKSVTDLGTSYEIVSADFKSDNQFSESSGIEHIRQDMRFRSYADHLIEIVREHKIDLIHAWGLFHQRGMIAAFAAAKCGIPYMISFRGVDLETRVFEKALPQISTSVLGARAIVCVSQDSKTLLERLFQPKAPVFVVNNHIDPTQFQAPKPVSIPALDELGLPVIGCFGKFRRVMGLDFLIQGFDLLNERGVSAALMLVGDPQKREADYYNQMLDRMKFKKNVVRVDYVPHSEVMSYMKRCSLLAYPSISDASPNKVLEAMFAQVPLVSTTAGGIPELVRNGIDGLLVPARTVEPLADAIKEMLTNPTRAKSMVESAYRRVTTDFHVKHEKPKWKSAYEKALS